MVKGRGSAASEIYIHTDRSTVKSISNVERTAFSLIFQIQWKHPWLATLVNTEHFPFVPVQSKGSIWQTAAALVILLILSVWVPVGRTPLKQLVTKRHAVLRVSLFSTQWKAFWCQSLWFMYSSKHTRGLKSKSIKVAKRHSRQLVTPLYSNEAFMWTTETHEPSL